MEYTIFLFIIKNFKLFIKTILHLINILIKIKNICIDRY